MKNQQTVLADAIERSASDKKPTLPDYSLQVNYMELGGMFKSGGEHHLPDS